MLAGTELLVVEPHIDEMPASLAGRDGVSLVDAQTAVKRSGVVVLLVDHDAFAEIDPSALDGTLLVDTRGLWSGAVSRG